MIDPPPNGNDGAADSRFESNGDGLPRVTLDVQQLSNLVEDQAVSLLDTDGQVATWNEGARHLTGYDESDVLGRHYRIFFPESAREQGRPKRLLERARETDKAEDEGWRLRNDGSRFWAREVIASVRASDVTPLPTADIDETDFESNDDLLGYANLLYDRTDDYERRRELREEKALTESIFEAQPDVVYAFDTEGNYLEWNDRVPEVTGYSDAELAEMGPTEFVPPDHRDRIADAIARLLEEDESVAVEADLLTKDGTRIPYEFNSARITAEDGTVLGFTGIGRDISDRKARERELREEKALTESIFEAQPDLLYAYDTEWNLIHWNDRFEELAGSETETLQQKGPLDFIAPPDRDRIERAIGRILAEGERVTAEARIVLRNGQYVPYEFNSAPITDADGTVLGFTGIGRDISERKAHERELERLERLNATIRAIDDAVITAETRSEIETAIVESFAAVDAYRFAAIGRTETTGADRRSWDPHAWEGIETTEFETLSSFVTPPADAGESAIETGTVQCFHRLRESAVDEWRRSAREHEYGSVAVVPVVAGGRIYDVLVVGAEEPTAFSDRERDVLTEFGSTIGHAINAMVVRRLLYQDTLVELEFESTDRRDLCVDLSARIDGRVTLDHVLPLTDETFVYYVTVTGAGTDRIRSTIADLTEVTEFRHIDSTEENGHWEFVVREPILPDLLADYGGRIRSIVAENGVSTIVVQVSPDVDVRDLVEALAAAYPEAELRSKRTVERGVETPGDFRRRIHEALTDKQRTALEAAFYGGYFEWPRRRSDAGEIADRLGVARQTFHQHLRVAQRKLLAAYFEGGAGDRSDAAG